MAAELDELIIAASSGDDEAIVKLSTKAKGLEVQNLREAAANFDFLFDTWSDAEEDFNAVKSDFVISLAERDALESQAFRTALNEAIRVMLPPYISSQAVLKAVGARDTAVQAHETVLRLFKLQKIRTGALVSFPDSRNWGKLTSIERVTATLGIDSLKTGNLSSFPVSSAFSATVFFDPHPDMYNIINPSRAALPSSSTFRKVLKTHALTEISEEKLKSIVQSLVVPECLGADAFEIWWTAEEGKAGSSGKRSPWEARSILELYTLLTPFMELGGLKLNDEQATKLAAMFEKQHSGMSTKDATMLSECIAMLSETNPASMLRVMFSGLRGKAPFWPESVENIGISKQLEVWGHVPNKELPAFVKASAQLYTGTELAALGCKLPAKCLTVLFESLDLKDVAAAIFADKELSSDVLVFLWKNKSKLPKNLTSILDMDHIAAAISMDKLPKEWASAQRDLKRTLFEKADFQKFVIDNADGDIPSIIDALQKVRTFQVGECQSLLVKLARHSDELREHIEGGEGKRLMGKSENPAAAADDTPVTSRASLAKLSRELEDIINVQIPDNVKAIAHARSFGDFRENAEYDAAKERRRFLHRRRNELETAVNTVRSTDFRDVKIADRVVLGSSVTLTGKDGKDIQYHILGAWDGDPDKNRISYRTRLGELLMGAKLGDKVKLPDGEFTVKTVAPLSEDLRKVLADDGM